ncbi:twin-arginine translocase TatA/TatE family subunit [Brevibacterium atlanticum]|uniref:twin-arginine translocase TatA/TatE family subunit n=1 Tax=Brevibacterium atlanticum TaxID=2697563 RepID=UPI001D196846|nr:twin-arginine translocase TatA/TatE family subunit [Brevibacterium atlanticum]
MLHNLTGWHALIILAIIILVFGAAKLPALAKSLGQSVRILKDETTETDKNANAVQVHEAVTDPIITDPVAGTPAGTSNRTSAEAGRNSAPTRNSAPAPARVEGDNTPASARVDPNLGDSVDTSAVRARS